ncbi:hypothetical protein H6771_01120 [Candidatus Peribacteria bacterium]|nr:hypothetical protein [Candidatus Peribacteria bacterium]
METIIKRTLTQLLDLFGAPYDVIGVTDEDGHYRANIETVDPGQIIGTRGGVLHALETLLQHFLWKETGDRVFFSLDVDNYRKQKDEELLERIRENITFMKENGLAEFQLRPMRPYLRRIVHLHIASHYPELTTDSTGEGRDRAVKILYK